MRNTETTIKENRHLLLWRAGDNGRGEAECLGRILAWIPRRDEDLFTDSVWMPVIHPIDTPWVYAYDAENDVDKHGYAVWVREAEE